jgi:hypothetical protein
MFFQQKKLPPLQNQMTQFLILKINKYIAGPQINEFK